MAIQVTNIAVKVLKIDDDTLSYAIKADVTNIKDDYANEEINAEIQGIDADGFEILTEFLSGKVPFGTTKTLSIRNDYQDREEFESVVKWQFSD